MVNVEIVNQPIELEIAGEPPVQIEVLRQTVEIETVAVQGVAGRDGASGGGARFEYTQPTPSALWIINHNLSAKITAIFVQDVLGNGIDGFGIENPSLNQTRLTFSPPLAGVAQIIGG